VYIDSHCHLERATYGDELDAVMARAVQSGVTHFVAVGAANRAAGAQEVVGLADRSPRVFAAVGIHPHDAAVATQADIDVVIGLLAHPRVVAHGEIGLDYHYAHAPQDQQRRLLVQLLGLGRVRDVPVMLHVREAHADACAILDDVGLPARGGVVHCFTGGPVDAEAYLRRGLMLSIPGVVTFKNAEPLRQAIRLAPVTHLLLETDCPYLAPVPYRGKRNEPAYIIATAAAVGAVKGLDAAEMGEIARQNAMRFFGLPEV
jgi:TatD DNase family protein